MKNFILAVAATLSFSAASAQSDTLFMHNGKNVIGSVKKVGEHVVTFTYANEDVEQVMGKYAIHKIVYGKSGRLQEITPKLHVKTEDDWENVMIVESLDEVAGLKRVDEIRGKTNMINYRTGAGSDNQALKKLKKEAADMGCPFVYITSDKDVDRKSASGGGYGQNQSIKRGVAYSY